MARDTAGTGGEGVTNAVQAITDGVSSILDRLGQSVSKNINPTFIAQTIQQVEESALSISKYFGQGREQILNIKTNMADAVVSVNKLGGDFEDIVRIQSSAAESLGRNVVLASESYEKLYAAQKVVGEQNSQFIFQLKNVGISIYQSTKEVEKVVAKAREIGVSAVAVTSQVSENLDMLNKYTFQGGVEGLAKMAAQAVNMRINIRDIQGTIDQAFNPESAIEMAASLQRLGVAQSDLLDPLRLMDLAQNDPAELQNQLAEMSKQFVKLNEKGQFEIMPGAKRQMMEIEKALGMSQGSLSKMALSSAELGDKMSKIRFPSDFTEEQKTMIANMAEMGEGGEYKMTFPDEKDPLNMEEAMAKIQSMSADQQKKFFEGQKPKDVTELANEQLSVSQQMNATLKSIENKLPYAVAGSRAADTLTGGIKKESKSLADALDTELTSVKTIRQKLNETTDGLADSFEGGKLNFDKLAETANNVGKYFNDILSEQFTNASTKLNGMLGKMENFFGGKSETKVTEDKGKAPVVKEAKDSLKLPGQEIKFLPEDSFISMTKGPEFLKTLEMMNKPSGGAGGIVNENKNTHDISLTVKIDGGNLSEDKIMAVLNKTETLQTLNKKLKETISNNGLMV